MRKARNVTIAIVFFLLFAMVFSGCSRKKYEVGNIPMAEPEQQLMDIHFEFDSYDLDYTAREKLKKNAEWLRNHPNVKVEIEGHCDERGTNEYNMALGMKRANAVKDYLVSLGIDASRLRTVSYGEELPIDPRHNEEAWAKNRRAHFRILE